MAGFNMSENTERRNVTREPSLTEGYVVYGRIFKRTVPCLVTEKSGRGARLWTHSMAQLPSKFRLYIGTEDEAGHEVEIVWSKGVEYGVSFKPLRSPRTAPTPAPIGKWRTA